MMDNCPGQSLKGDPEAEGIQLRASTFGEKIVEIVGEEKVHIFKPKLYPGSVSHVV